MAFQIGELSASVTADMNPFSRSMKNVHREGEKATNETTKGFRKIGSAATQVSAIITSGVVASIGSIGMQMLKTASDFEETSQKFDVVFQDISDSANAAATDLQESFGLSSQSSRQLLGDVGDILTGFGFTQETALDLSTQVNKLAVDLASFTNFAGGAEGASRALTKALLGEAESVKALGIVIRQDTKEYNNLVESIMKAKNVGLVQAKALAALEIATKQSKNAIGDFSRTQGSLANQTRQLKEDYEDLSIVLGQEFIPIANEAVGVARDMIRIFIDNKDGIIMVTKAFSKAVNPLGQVFGLLGEAKRFFNDTDESASNAANAVSGVADSSEEATDGLGGLNDELQKIPQKPITTINGLNREIQEGKRLSDELSMAMGSLSATITSLGRVTENVPPVVEIFDPSVLHETMIPLEEIVQNMERIGQDGSGQFLQLTQEITTAQKASVFFADSLAGGLERVVFQGGKAINIIKDLVSQLASKALFTGLAALFTGGSAIAAKGFFGSMFGGLFHSGGTVPGNGSKMIRAKGGETIFTPSQTQALGGMIGGGNIDYGKLEHAVANAMQKSVAAMSPDQAFLFTQKGRRGY